MALVVNYHPLGSPAGAAYLGTLPRYTVNSVLDFGIGSSLLTNSSLSEVFRVRVRVIPLQRQDAGIRNHESGNGCA